MTKDRYAPRAGMGTPARLSERPMKLIEGETKAQARLTRMQAQQYELEEAKRKATARKPWLDMQARFLLTKFSAILLASDDVKSLLTVSRWALCKSFTVTADAEAWLIRVGGPNA